MYGLRKQVREAKERALDLRRKTRVNVMRLGEEERGGKSVGILPRWRACWVLCSKGF